MRNANTVEKIIIMGERNAILMSIWYAFCTLETSVVILVTRLEAENLSMFENEKFWML